MGSGSTRKTNDRVIINEPKSKGGAGGRGGGRQETLVCPASFKIKLPKDTKVPAGAHLDLEKQKNGLLAVQFNYKTITELSKNRSEEIEGCLAQGFRYAGLAKLSGDESFAEFTRS